MAVLTMLSGDLGGTIPVLERTEIRWRNPALRGSFIGRGDLQNDAFLARLGAKNQRKRQAGRFKWRRSVGADRQIGFAVRGKLQHRVVGGAHIAGWDQHFGCLLYTSDAADE